MQHSWTNNFRNELVKIFGEEKEMIFPDYRSSITRNYYDKNSIQRAIAALAN